MRYIIVQIIIAVSILIIPVGLSLISIKAMTSEAEIDFMINIQSNFNFKYLDEIIETKIPTKAYVISVAIAAPRIPKQ